MDEQEYWDVIAECVGLIESSADIYPRYLNLLNQLTPPDTFCVAAYNEGNKLLNSVGRDNIRAHYGSYPLEKSLDLAGELLECPEIHRVSIYKNC